MGNESNNQLSEVEWKQLGDLRKTYLAEDFNHKKDYWNSNDLLRLYESTFAQRIGWKWDAILSEISNKGFFKDKQEYILYDFGCGTGIASRKMCEFFGVNLISAVWLWDFSKKAVRFSADKLKSLYPGLIIEELNEVKVPGVKWILCVSHLINELSENEFDRMIKLAEDADFIIWLEPGTKLHSKRLIEIRERLVGKMKPLAPCTHSNICGMRSEENISHWCHFFAPVPATVFQSSFWKKFSEKMKIDLRSLPISYLVLSKEALVTSHESRGARVIGRPRFSKGQGKFLVCDFEGVTEHRLLERNEKELFREFKSTVFSREIKK